MRFKSVANTGAHVGNLWTANGTLLATATFTSESASGWQQVSFQRRFRNREYRLCGVVSRKRWALLCRLRVSHQRWLRCGAAAPIGAIAGGNGVYSYGPSSLPTQTFNATNYWVDVVFNQVSADATPPTVRARRPRRTRRREQCDLGGGGLQ